MIKGPLATRATAVEAFRLHVRYYSKTYLGTPSPTTSSTENPDQTRQWTANGMEQNSQRNETKRNACAALAPAK